MDVDQLIVNRQKSAGEIINTFCATESYARYAANASKIKHTASSKKLARDWVLIIAPVSCRCYYKLQM